MGMEEKNENPKKNSNRQSQIEICLRTCILPRTYRPFYGISCVQKNVLTWWKSKSIDASILSNLSFLVVLILSGILNGLVIYWQTLKYRMV